MEDSILKSTKKILGVVEDVDAFDLDILTHINSALSIVSQVGIGPSNGFFIEDEDATWSEVSLPADQLGLLRTYVFLNVQMLFDPPGTSFLIDAKQKQLDEHLIRLSYYREALISEDELGSFNDDSASGTQTSASTVWIMNHDLGFNPAGFRFTTLDGLNELEPESITYITINRTLASWPTPIAGKWYVS